MELMASTKLLRLRKEVHVAPVVEERYARAYAERRGAPRSSVRVPLKVTVPSVEAVFTSESVNISHTGLFLATDTLLEVGTPVQVEITLEGGGLLLHASAEVVRQERRLTPQGVGLRFTDVSYEAQALIDRLLRDESLFGNYRLERLIGRGGMGEVYRAKVLEGPYAGRWAAVKRIRPELQREAFAVEMFEREAALARQLKHPHVVEVLDVGTVEGACYIAMDYVHGCNLNQILDECRHRNIFLPLDFCAYLGHVVAEALQYAHTATDGQGRPLGIIHRDVAPGNIFISTKGEILLGDFGIALSAMNDAERVVMAGKDPYLSPEALLHQPLGPSSDIFALGAVLYELVTNRRAFEGQSRHQMWRKILGGDFPPPSHHRPDISSQLEGLILRAMSPRSGERARLAWRARWRELARGPYPVRFTTAQAFADALRPLYNPAIGTQMAIASVVRNLLKDRLGGF